MSRGLLIREMPDAERPRERLMERGLTPCAMPN